MARSTTAASPYTVTSGAIESPYLVRARSVIRDFVETAAALAVSLPTVKRDWALARAWLFRALGERTAT